MESQAGGRRDPGGATNDPLSLAILDNQEDNTILESLIKSEQGVAEYGYRIESTSRELNKVETGVLETEDSNTRNPYT